MRVDLTPDPSAAVSKEGPTRPSPELRAPRVYEQTRVREILALLALEGGVDIDYVETGEEVFVTLVSPESCTWVEVLEQVVLEAGLELRQRSSRLYTVREAPRVTIHFRDAPVLDAVLLIASETGFSVVVGAEVVGSVSVNLRDVPARQAIELIARTGGYALVEEGAGWAVRRPGAR